MRSICVVTGARSDWGIYLPILQRIREEPTLDLQVVATGMHLAPAFGDTVHEIEEDGFVVADRVHMLLASDGPEAIAASMGIGTIGFAPVLARLRPDILLVLGDRFDMLPAAIAALPLGIPLAHIHGGESTEGLIDESIRHSLTKLSHLHFPSTDLYARRIVQMGEEPWRVLVSGAPSLDKLRGLKPLARSEVEQRIGLSLAKPTVVVTYHPVTLEHERVEERVDALLDALATTAAQIVFTYPNADTNAQTVLSRVRAFADARPGATVVTSLGSLAYFSLLGFVDAMIGNSSSGIIEAASFELPVVDVGMRQRGRLRARNVIGTGDSTAEIAEGIARALDPTFRVSLAGLANPYGDGHAAERIVTRLRDVELGPRLLVKRFHDLPDPEA
jgi:UDP-hydrolysing UDP-N-acetyl-D-glucosamine 2-epimerase